MEIGRSYLRKEVLDDLDHLAGLFRILAEPNRVRILYLLMQRETCVCELLPELGISQPLLSHHLRTLAEAGLVQPRRQAQRIFYSVVPETLARLKKLLLKHFDPDRLPPQAAPGQGVEQQPMLSEPIGGGSMLSGTEHPLR